MQFVVARYLPPGNVLRQFDENVFRSGSSPFRNGNDTNNRNNDNRSNGGHRNAGRRPDPTLPPAGKQSKLLLSTLAWLCFRNLYLIFSMLKWLPSVFWVLVEIPSLPNQWPLKTFWKLLWSVVDFIWDILSLLHNRLLHSCKVFCWYSPEDGTWVSQIKLKCKQFTITIHNG